MAAASERADNYAQKNVQITFVDNRGQTTTCGLANVADHNTDDPNQPYTEVNASLNGPEPCYQLVAIEVTISYKDENGVARQTTSAAITDSLKLTAYKTYSAINATAKAHYYDCDPDKSAACDLAVGVSPK